MVSLRLPLLSGGNKGRTNIPSISRSREQKCQSHVFKAMRLARSDTPTIGSRLQHYQYLLLQQCDYHRATERPMNPNRVTAAGIVKSPIHRSAMAGTASHDLLERRRLIRQVNGCGICGRILRTRKSLEYHEAHAHRHPQHAHTRRKRVKGCRCSGCNWYFVNREEDWERHDVQTWCDRTTEAGKQGQPLMSIDPSLYVPDFNLNSRSSYVGPSVPSIQAVGEGSYDPFNESRTDNAPVERTNDCEY
jgi:hypothetical protein